MKKMILAVATAFVMGLAFTSCSGNKGDQMISEMEELVEKAEKVKDDPAKLMELVGEFGKLGEKFKDLKEEDFTPEQAKKIEELGEKLEKMFD